MGLRTGGQEEENAGVQEVWHSAYGVEGELVEFTDFMRLIQQVA